MIDAPEFVGFLDSAGVDLYTGVPDSLLRPLCSAIMALPPERHVLAANEGNAIGIAIGHYLRTGSPAVVYLQNSGFGNTINPLISLADPDVYGVPMILFIGWRGEVGVPDEPQHVTQGRIMPQLLDALEVPWATLPDTESEARRAVEHALDVATRENRPYVLMVRKGTFGGAAKTPSAASDALATREEMLSSLIEAIGSEPIIVSTTGMLSRELFELRQQLELDGSRDFLTVGGMGHASSIALGIAMREPRREVWCLDGDGALLMHLGSLPVISDHAPPNFMHAIFNNGVHDSVGGQPTSIGCVDLAATARSVGYRHTVTETDPNRVVPAVGLMRSAGGPSLLELKVKPGNRPDLGRPTRGPAESKVAFMKAIAGPPSIPSQG